MLRIGDRLRAIREMKNLSQGNLGKRAGVVRNYISRIENGHAVPIIQTLEILSRALEVPLYQLLYDGEEPPAIQSFVLGNISEEGVWGSSGKEARDLANLRRLLGRIKEDDRQLLLAVLEKMVRRKSVRHRRVI
jgi:transcriptional regulator with XRE-family HTH domain